MWKIIYSKKYWTFHIKSLCILLHWYWKQISFETNITSLWKIDFLILLLLHFIFTILLLIWKNRKLRLGVDRWRVEPWEDGEAQLGSAAHNKYNLPISNLSSLFKTATKLGKSISDSELPQKFPSPQFVLTCSCGTDTAGHRIRLRLILCYSGQY